MKLFKAVLFVSALATGTLASAQGAKCKESLEVFKKTVVNAAYNDAALMIPDLQKNCAKADEAFYSYGDKVFQYRIESARSEQDKKKVVEAAMAFYDAQLKNFPSSDAEIKKALLMEAQKAGDDKQMFSLLDHAYTVNKASFTDYRALDLYFRLYFAKFSIKENNIAPEVFLQKYVDVLGQINEAREGISVKRAAYLKKKEEQIIEPAEQMYLNDTQYSEKSLDAVADNISKQVLPLVDCAGLEAFYGPKFKNNVESVAWISGMVKALKAAGCTKTDLYFNGVSALYKLRPSYDAAYQLAQAWQKKGKIAEAIVYYEEAVKLQPNPVRKAELYMVVAELYRAGDKAKAKEYALKAASANPKTGMPYLFIAEQYMSLTAGDCGLGEFDRKALVWVAIATLKKAEAAEPRFSATVASMEKEYSKRIPTKKEAKAAKRSKDDVITYGCWINETVTLPKLK
jgi:tetratricopeptide (TPR) repeat protein